MGAESALGRSTNDGRRCQPTSTWIFLFGDARLAKSASTWRNGHKSVGCQQPCLLGAVAGSAPRRVSKPSPAGYCCSAAAACAAAWFISSNSRRSVRRNKRRRDATFKFEVPGRIMPIFRQSPAENVWCGRSPSRRLRSKVCANWASRLLRQAIQIQAGWTSRTALATELSWPRCKSIAGGRPLQASRAPRCTVCRQGRPEH
jgi:hypothetical protein